MKKALTWLSTFFKSPDQPPATPPNQYHISPVISPLSYQLVMNCNQKDIDLLDGLVRYYETRYEGVIGRGIWLLTLMRNSEIESKKLAVIEIDEESGQVLSVSPITLQ